MPTGLSVAHLESIHVYPVKSAGGVELAEVEIELRGPRDDRLWMVVEPSGRFVTQREEPRLALLRPQATAQGWSVAAPGMARVELRPEPARRLPVRVWDDEVDAVRCTAEAEIWLSGFLGRPALFVSMDAASRRTDVFSGQEERVARFADALPLLVLSRASLEDLNARLAEPLPMERFRPNLVIGGCEPFEEDLWDTIRVGEVEIELAVACARCVITTIDQARALPDPRREPLRTLATFRRRTRAALELDPGPVYFGWRSVPLCTGRVRVGDEVAVLRARPA